MNLVTHLKPIYKLFKDLVKKQSDAFTSGNRTFHKGRLVYKRRTEARMTDTNPYYAYICWIPIRETREEDFDICLRTTRYLD